MKTLNKIMLASGLMALTSTPAFAFWDEVVAGMTSVGNNLIDSTENVTISSLNTTSNTVLLLSRDIGRMADRIDRMADKIGVMADRIGVMADRIVVTESMMADFAHKVVDKGHDLAVLQYAASNGVPAQAPSRLQAGYQASPYPQTTYPPAYQQPAYQQPAYQPVAQAPHRLRVSDPALNPYLPRPVYQAESGAEFVADVPAYSRSSVPVADKVSTRCLADLPQRNGRKAC